MWLGPLVAKAVHFGKQKRIGIYLGGADFFQSSLYYHDGSQKTFAVIPPERVMKVSRLGGGHSSRSRGLFE